MLATTGIGDDNGDVDHDACGDDNDDNGADNDGEDDVVDNDDGGGGKANFPLTQKGQLHPARLLRNL